MDREDDMEIDPALAAAMGFSGFGVQPGKKRKYDNDAFIDPDTTKADQGGTGKGANSMPLGQRKAGQHGHGGNDGQHAMMTGTATVTVAEASLEQLKQGVRNERGDMVYFQPSFIDDPWKDLTPK
jgi:hypothetical protein